MTRPAMNSNPCWICDGCDARWWGANKRDVLDDGWKFHDAKRGRMLVLCGACEQRFAARRARTHLPALACSCAQQSLDPALGTPR